MDQENEYNDPRYHGSDELEEQDFTRKTPRGKPLADADLENAAQLVLLFTLKWQPKTGALGEIPIIQPQFRRELNSLLEIVGQAVVKSTFSKIKFTERTADETDKPNPNTPTSA